VVLLSSDEVGHPSPWDVHHHEAFYLFYPPRTLPLFHTILHVRRSVLPLDVLVHKWSIRGYLQSVSVLLQNYLLPLHVTSLIWIRFCLRRHTFTISIIGGDFFTSCPALFTAAMRVPAIFARGRGRTVL
jgi:hypothetical protein